MALLNDMHDMETYQKNVQFMEYEAYHCLDLIAPQLDVLSWPYKWNVLHNGFIPNHLNPSLQMSKGRHKGKIQLSIGLPVQKTAHPHISNEKLFFKKIKQRQNSFQCLQKRWVHVITAQGFWSSTRHNFYCKSWEDRKKGGREREKTKGQSSWRGWKGEYIYIPRSSTRTSGHEMQKLKINCWHLEKLIRGKNKRVYIKRAKHRW